MTRRAFAPALLVLALAACGRGDPAPAASPSPSESASATPSATASPTPAGTRTAAVYYLGQSALLYREFRQVPRSADAVRTAVDAMLHVAPLDRDYRSLWPAATTVNGVTIAGTVATVDLSAAARQRSATEREERQSLQQLVHTVTAAAPAVTGVRLRFGGASAATLWGHVATTGTFTRAAAIDTLGAIWVVSPASGAAVGRTIAVTGVASVFEATVTWSLKRPNGAAIDSGFVTASEGAPGRGTWSVTVHVPAAVTGDVVFTAWEDSAEDGSVLHPDDKTWRV